MPFYYFERAVILVIPNKFLYVIFGSRRFSFGIPVGSRMFYSRSMYAWSAACVRSHLVLMWLVIECWGRASVG